MILRNSFFSALFMMSLLSANQVAFASCEREDVDYYLGKGFTPEQITKICASKAQVTIEPKENIDLPSISKGQEEGEGIEFLTSAIAATQVHFFEDKFSYVSRECVEYDPLPSGLTVGGKKFCGFIRKTIDYRNLAVVNKPLLSLNFFAKPSVLIKGDIDHEVLNAEKVNQLTKHDRKLLTRKLSEVKTANIPVREEFLIDRVRKGINNLTK